MLMNPRSSTAAGPEVREADVLLTHSYHLPYDRKQLRKMQPYSPLGTLYAAALLRERDASVAVFDSMLNEPTAGFREALRIHRPKIVAIYEDDFNFLTKMCLTRMRELAWEMIGAAREAGARVVVHGSDASDHAAEYLRNGCEYVLDGEAECASVEEWIGRYCDPWREMAERRERPESGGVLRKRTSGPWRAATNSCA